ncbi:hypothetical protein C8R47DRAFT_1324299 [Mycena vitilis]|nr:hypothetical protein C8R47DRAFT_1324299 [Mycena vitilis]
MAPPSFPDMGTKGLITGTEQGNPQYVLRTRNMFNLLKYLWTGALLGDDAAAYRIRTGITLDTYKKTQLDPLVASYKQLKGHCMVFKNQTYKDIVRIADSIYTYADKASGGGDLDASYYKLIFDTVRQIAACTAADPPSKVANLRAGLKDGLDTMVATINALKVQATEVTTKLNQFETDCRQDHAHLSTAASAVSTALGGVDGDIAALQAKIKKDQTDLESDETKREHDVVLMETSAAYAWCGPVGAIAAVTVLIVYGVKKGHMEGAMSALNKKLTTERQDIADDRAIAAELGNAKTDIECMINLIRPAVEAIECMIGEWDAIAKDLQAIQEYVDKDVRGASLFFSHVVENRVIHMWTVLAKAVDDYRKQAYISDMPKVTTLTQYLKDLAAAKAKAGGVH